MDEHFYGKKPEDAKKEEGEAEAGDKKEEAPAEKKEEAPVEKKEEAQPADSGEKVEPGAYDVNLGGGEEDNATSKFDEID